MTDIRYPLATSTWDSAEYDALQAVIASDRFTMGPLVRQFEQEFAARMGSRYVVMVNSGSSANLAGVAAAVLHPGVNLNPGDEVLVPAVSWATTYYPIHQYGLKLKFVDIDQHTLNYDLEALRAAIGPNTRAICVVNLLGNPNDFDVIGQIAAEHDLVVFEDNCESLGATYHGRETGTFGLFGTYSSFFSHHISTMEGGLIVTDDEQLYQMMISLRAHGWTRELPVDNHVFPKTGDEFDDLFRFVLPGYNLRPLEMSGALGIQQLKKLDGIVAGRRENAELFVETFGDDERFSIQREIGESSWFGFSFLLQGENRGSRPAVTRALREAGIEVRPIVAGNFAKNPVIAHMDVAEIGELPNADAVHDNGFFVGNHHYPIADMITYLSETLDRALAASTRS